MYDFTHCISDALEGITHSLRTLEFQYNRRLYDCAGQHHHSGSPAPVREFSRLNLEYTVMSKRKPKCCGPTNTSKADDPRMPTTGTSRRGYTGLFVSSAQTHRRHQLRQHH